jgi:PAS domain S-box-containing protein
VLQLAPEKSKYNISPHLEFFEDVSGELIPADIVSPNIQQRFRAVGPGTPSFGMTRSAIWIRFSLEAPPREAESPPPSYILEMGWPYLSSADLYVAEEGRLRVIGPMDPDSQLHEFKLTIEPQQAATFYARIKSDSAMILPLSLYTPGAYNTAMNRRMLWYGMFYGILLAVTLYNFLTYGSLRERVHIWCAIVFTFAAVYLAVCDPLTSTLLDVSFFERGGPMRHVLLSALMMSFGLFARVFLKAEHGSVVSDKVLLIFVICAAFGMALTPIAPLQLLLQYDSLLGLAAPFVFIPPAISQWRLGLSPARFFFFGWLALAILGFLDVLVIRGILPFSDWTLTALQIWVIIVALQFSHAVGYRIRALRDKREAALRASEETFRALAENSRDMIMRFDSDCRHLYVNPIAEQETGITPREFIGKTPEELGAAQGIAALWRGAIQKVIETRSPLRIEVQRTTGKWSDWLLVPELDQTGQATAILASGRDITERKCAEEQQRLLEAQLGQAQKMESIGRLAGGVAHDFNNLLMAMLGYSEMTLKYGKDLSGNVKEWLEQIQKAGERARDLTQQLLAFGRKQTLQMQVVDVNEVIAGFGSMLKRLIGEDIEVETVLAPALGAVKADSTQLEQVLLNLAVNARDAMPIGGRLKIETGNAVLDEGYAATDPYVQPGEYVMLAISDTGCGMSPETRRKAFEPFFTTKETGKGTGLGLATVYGIVKQHHGHISVQSEPGQGTTIRIYFPRVHEP